jgi:hypothetical protein
LPPRFGETVSQDDWLDGDTDRFDSIRSSSFSRPWPAPPGRVFGREELLDIVWGRDGFVEPRTVDVHVARLRRKFTIARLEEPGIETVRGVGYRFRDKP